MKKYYAIELKMNLIQRYNSGETVATIIADTHIPRSTLYSWIRESKESHSCVNPEKYTKQQIIRLETKIASLEERLQILQSVDCTARSPLKEKLKCLESLSGQYSVHALCDALDVPRGTYYNHMRRNKKDNTYYAKRREDLRAKIQNIYDEHHQILGAAKIAVILNQQNEHVSVEMVRELMRDMGLLSIRQEAKKAYDKETRKFHNHLNQNFNTDQPNQVWVSDVTYFKFNNKSYFICAILDLFSRRVVGYKVGKVNSTQLVKSTFLMAYTDREPVLPLTFHTDRGSNYHSKTFCTCLREHGITQSFSRAHIPYDNSVMESFFSNLKREELYRTKYRSENEFKTAVDNYMTYYNERRPHAKNAYKTPLKKELEYYNEQALL